MTDRATSYAGFDGAPLAIDTPTLASRYRQIRQFSETLCETLEIEDFVVQSMPDVSPTRWHLAHTTWFFDTFLLSQITSHPNRERESYRYLFNSYYNQVGEQFPRHQRGLITRPTVAEVFEYRREVDLAITEWLENSGDSLSDEQRALFETGLHHEQQHQELMLTDIKHVFSMNPLHPVFCERENQSSDGSQTLSQWDSFEDGIYEIGFQGEGFSFDNESPRHEVLLRSFELSQTLVTAGEFLEFIQDGGYQRPELWLSLGWQVVQQFGWQAPMYWQPSGDRWRLFSLSGMREIDEREPVCHVSFFEADAFARWKGARLPTEAEWESAAMSQTTKEPNYQLAGNFVERRNWHPIPLSHEQASGGGIKQLFGDVWEWTASPYVGYPGYRPPAGAIGEYNGKFMCNQFVLRGGSCATSRDHIRPTYRNFFPPEARWQFSGFRLARDPS